jgi:hypothetical protein
MPRGWGATRARILARDGWRCRLALPGCITIATEAHHTDPGNEDESLIIAACAPCHHVVTQAQAAAARWG